MLDGCLAWHGGNPERWARFPLLRSVMTTTRSTVAAHVNDSQQRLMAATGPIWHLLQQAGYDADLEFYEQFTRDHGPVLELGAGGGRVAAYLTEDVDGVDIDRELLEDGRHLFRRTCVADATKLELGVGLPRYERIIAPVAFVQLVRPADRRSLLRGIQDHLRPGGRVALDLSDLTNLAHESELGRYRHRCTWYTMYAEPARVVDGVLHQSYRRVTWNPLQGRRELAPWGVNFHQLTHEQLVEEAEIVGFECVGLEMLVDSEFISGSVTILQCPES